MRITETVTMCRTLEFDLEGNSVQCLCRDGIECLSGFSMDYSDVCVALWGVGRNSHVCLGRYDRGVIGIACEELMS